jgi:FKBP-type peptidyl-prolyl cis-trans isomerase
VKDRAIIFVLIGALLFSAVATTLYFVADNSTPPEETAQTEEQVQACEPSAEVASQAGKPAGEWPIEVEPATELEIIELREGTGAAAAIGNCITVHYRLALADGTPVAGNDTFETGTGPISFELTAGGLIEGWIQGIPGLKEGGLRRLIVPPSLAYGEAERNGIPANSTLVFDVELVKVEY